MQMQYTKYMSNKSILGILHRSCGFVDPRLMDHGARVAYLIFLMVKDQEGLSNQRIRDICLLGQLHDIGAYKTEEISRMLVFETQDIWEHSFYGYLFIKYFTPLSSLAEGVLLHHAPWSLLEAEECLSSRQRNLAQLICIADRIDISISVELKSWEDTKKRLEMEKGSRFAPHITDLALRLDLPSSLTEAMISDSRYQEILQSVPLTCVEIGDYLKMLVYIIDFRSRHTVTHTMTTASISYLLADRMDLDEEKKNQILCGALLHDLGKIGIPVEILEYPGKLSPQAMSVMRTHVALTEKIFGGQIDPAIQKIALRHHEKLDGSGYPLGLTERDLTIPQRIVAIADIVSALSGTRSYKSAFPKARILSIINQMKLDGFIDGEIVDLMILHFDEIMEQTSDGCRPVLETYEKMRAEFTQFLEYHSGRDIIHYALSLERDSPSAGEFRPLYESTPCQAGITSQTVF